uniref:DEK-C domain-containing protein n=1 Tax=Hucho hucho TaxID=62062 RepID=A0A4W5MHL2_9TELE
MMQKDLENVTCKEIRTELEVHMVCNLCEFKEYIDNEMILILGQMDSPTEIFNHVYLVGPSVWLSVRPVCLALCPSRLSGSLSVPSVWL